ncbi:integrase [Spirochaetia bacterium]|nr:integrase [Spirochaetia bacterium]
MKERQALADVTGSRYRMAKKTGKSVILGGFCKSTGYNRKYAITILQNAGKTQLRRIDGKTVKVKITAKTHRKRVYKHYYGEDVETAVLTIWRFLGGICGKRLIPMIRENLEALFADKGLNLSLEAKTKTAEISRCTVERMLRGERKRCKTKGTCATKPGTLLKQQIPVRTFWHWDDKKPGFTEVDTVSHDGGYAEGEFAYTLSLTDVALCWSEFRALRNKARKWTLEQFEDIRTSFPVPLKGIDSDNGSEFINWHLKGWCETNEINFTRGRQYHKNDNAYVEQKNGDIVRKTVGYGRFEGDNALSALSAVYMVMNPLYNFFYPNLKCVNKIQVGQRTRRVYEKEAKTPYRRVMESPDVSEDLKQRLADKKNSLNIISLQRALDSALEHLDRLVQHSPGSVDCPKAHG